MGCIYSGKYLSSICLVGEMSVGDVTLGMCLVGEASVGDVPGRGRVRRGCVWSGKCLSGKCLSGKSPSGKRQSGMCPRIINLYTKVLEIII